MKKTLSESMEKFLTWIPLKIVPDISTGIHPKTTARIFSKDFPRNLQGIQGIFVSITTEIFSSITTEISPYFFLEGIIQ